MDLKDIRQLIKMVDESNVDEVRLEKDDFKIVVRKGRGFVTMQPSPAQPVSYQMQAPPVAPAPVSPAVTAAAAPAASEAPAASAKYHEIKSPIVGTFYTSPAPDADVYVKPGDSVSAGDVICIIEAMKLMNEIESDVSGKIVKVMVENGKPVEFGQVLFLVEPNK